MLQNRRSGKRSGKSVAIAVLIFAVLMIQLVPVGSAIPPESQSWYLTDYEPTGSVTLRSMNKTYAPKKGNNDVGLVTSSSARIWRADEAASTTVDMSGKWQVNIEIQYDSNGSGQRTITIQIGVRNGSTFTKKSNPMSYGHMNPGDNIIWTGNLTTTNHIINSSEYVALKIYVNASTTNTTTKYNYMRVIVTNATGSLSPSWIKSPDTDPGYPVPELSSFALFSAGLICAVAIIAMSKKHERKS